MFNKNYILHKEDDRWVFETVEDGKIVKHRFTAKRRAINGVLRLNPGDRPILISFDNEDK